MVLIVGKYHFCDTAYIMIKFLSVRTKNSHTHKHLAIQHLRLCFRNFDLQFRCTLLLVNEVLTHTNELVVDFRRTRPLAIELRGQLHRARADGIKWWNPPSFRVPIANRSPWKIGELAFTDAKGEAGLQIMHNVIGNWLKTWTTVVWPNSIETAWP